MRAFWVALALAALSAAPALAQPARPANLPRPPDSGVAFMTGVDAGGAHVGAGLKLGTLSVDATAGFYLIIATLTTDPFVQSDPELEVASSFSFSGRARYLPIQVRRGALGGSVAAHYNTVLGFGVSVGPEAEIYLRDTISLRVGATLVVFPDGEEQILEEFGAEAGTDINYPFGGNVNVRGTFGVMIYL